MKGLRYTWALIRYRPGLFLINCILWGLFHTIPLLSGLLSRAYFDRLSAGGPGAGGVWVLVALMGVAGAARIGVFRKGFRTFVRLWYLFEAVVRRNLMHWTLQGPGSHPLAESGSQSVTRFREDVGDVSDYVEAWVDMAGIVLFALVARHRPSHGRRRQRHVHEPILVGADVRVEQPDGGQRSRSQRGPNQRVYRPRRSFGRRQWLLVRVGLGNLRA